MRGLTLRGTILYHPEPSEAPTPFAHHSPVPVKMGLKGKAKMEKVMHEYGAGALKSSSGRTVTSRDQAVAIALNSARKKRGGKGT